MNRNIILGFLSICFMLTALGSCNKIPVGYLNTDNACFTPDTIYAYRNIDMESDRYINQSPWTSLMIQGVAGTNPINYEFYGVRVEDGGSIEAFNKIVEDGNFVVRGGLVQLFQKGVEMIPNGKYVISIKVYNEGYSDILKDIITFSILDEEPLDYDDYDDSGDYDGSGDYDEFGY